MLYHASMTYKNNNSTQVSMRPSTRTSLTILLIVTAIGAIIRWVGLSRLSLMMDSVWIYFMCQKGVTAGQMMTNWLHVGGAPSTFPFAVAATEFIIQTFHIPLSTASLIFPSTLWGTACIPAAYFAGKIWGNRKTGIVLCSMVAFSPIMVQLSREAYFYSPMLLGAFLSLWTLGASSAFALKDARLPRMFHPINALSAFLMAYSSPSAWTYTAAVAAAHSFFILYRIIRKRDCFHHLMLLGATYMVVGIPLLMAEWGLQNILDFTSGPTKAYWEKVFRGIKSRNVGQLLFIWRQCLWGTTPVRTVFSLLALLSALVALVFNIKRDRRNILPITIFVIIIIGNIIALQKSVWGLGLRYLSALIPIYFMLIAQGLL
jgi:hypothetical protein